MRHTALLLAAGACLATLPGMAAAGVPSAANSTVPPCMSFCPLGDIGFTVVVRDAANNPQIGSNVLLDFSNCAGAFVCTPPMPSDPYVVGPGGRTLSMTANALGEVTLPARVGGTAPAGCVRVFADGVLLRSVPLSSPDQNGNGVAVTILDDDFARFTAKLGTSDPTADFDCDGDVDLDDQLLLGMHGAHSCFGIVLPARRGSWGRLKSHYR